MGSPLHQLGDEGQGAGEIGIGGGCGEGRRHPSPAIGPTFHGLSLSGDRIGLDSSRTRGGTARERTVPRYRRAVSESKERPASPPREALPWWQRGLPVAGLTALVGFLVQVSTGVQGWLDSLHSRNLAEQELVKEHLESALQNEATEKVHMRRMDFLRKLGEAEDRGFLAVLAEWADEEYSEYFRFQEYHAEGLAEVYEYKLLRWLRLERMVLTGRGFIAEEARKLELSPPEDREKLQRGYTAIADAEDKIAALDEQGQPLLAELEALKGQWKEVNMQFVLSGEIDRCDVCRDKGVAFEDALLWLEKECTPTHVQEVSDPQGVAAVVASLQPAARPEAEPMGIEEPTRKDKVAEYCIELGEQLWARSLGGQIETRLTEAAGFFHLACEELGSRKACALYGRSLQKGKGVDRDLAKAVDYFDLACPVGWFVAQDEESEPAEDDAPPLVGPPSPEGCNSLAWRYFNAEQEQLPGRDHERDFNMAKRLARYACDTGYMNACDSLGHFLTEEAQQPGPFPSNDALRREGEQLLAYACDRREVRACLNLGRVAIGQRANNFTRH